MTQAYPEHAKKGVPYTIAPVVVFPAPGLHRGSDRFPFAPARPTISPIGKGGMTMKTGDVLNALGDVRSELKAGQDATLAAVQQQGEVLRLIAERLGLVLEKLYPEESDGPSLQELLAELVGRTGDNTALLRRIDQRTESMAIQLLSTADRTMEGSDGANGDSANGHGSEPIRADGHRPNGANGNGHAA